MIEERRAFLILVSDKNLIECGFYSCGDKIYNIIKSGEKGHFGMGFFYEGEFLQKKLPILTPTNIKDLISKVKSNQIFLYFQKNPPFSFKTEFVQPFRYRNWLAIFRTNLKLTSKLTTDILQKIPSYITRSLKSNTSEEILFLLFLYSLHCEGKLDAIIMHQEYGLFALKKTFDTLKNILESSKLPEIECSISSGQFIYATTTKQNSLYYSYLEGIEKCLKCSDIHPTTEKDKKIISHQNLRVFALARGNHASYEDWNCLPPFTIITTSEYVEAPKFEKID